MGVSGNSKKNLGLAFFGASTIALAIALGVTLANKENQTKSVKSANGNTITSNSTGGDGAATSSVVEEDSRGAALFEIDLSSSTLACPETAGSSQTFSVTDLTDPAAVDITVSSANTLCTLVRIHNPSGDGTAENTFLQPLARSYSGHDWEVSRGKFVQEASFDCSAGESCAINLTKIEEREGGGTYQLSTFGVPSQYTKKDIIARFLEQATFGATPEALEALDTTEPGDMNSLKESLALAGWIQDQMDQERNPIMSHRALFRQHLNARFEIPGPLGRVSLPCEKGARFRRTAFSEKNQGKMLELVTSGNKKLFKMNDKVITAFEPPLYFKEINGEVITELWWPDGKYKICSVRFDQYTALSTVTLQHPGYSKCIALVVQAPDGYYYSNAPIEVHAESNDVILNIPTGSAQLIDSEYALQQQTLSNNTVNSPEHPEIILTVDLSDSVCAELKKKDGGGDKAVIAEWNGNYYVHDPRYHLLENSIASPSPDGGAAIANEYGSVLGTEDSAICANPARNFLNEDSCFLSDTPTACSYRDTKAKKPRQTQGNLTESDVASVFEVTLDKLQAVYESTGSGEDGTVYLYAVDGLDVNKDPTIIPPCQIGARARWVQTPCSNSTAEGLGASTIEFFEKRLAARLKSNTNKFFVDWWHNRKWGDCDPEDNVKVGFQIRNIQEPGTCFRHVHSDHLSVFDFTSWAKSHPGNSDNRNPITEFHKNGESILKFPDWHEMDRWTQQKTRLRPKLLALGNEWDFYNLPLPIRTKEVAEGLGVRLENQVATPTASEDDKTSGPYMICGSPFEVANDPFLGGNTERGAFDALSVKDTKTSRRAWLNSQRSFTWLIAAMSDPGQLRQRVAWALSQIFAIAESSIRGGADLTEPFVVYYDIFVRNAFGNYRDIMKEVSYSPMMAEMLSYVGGRATHVALEDEGIVEYADENYAREIMQLFSLGLYQLNQDGTPKLNDQGETNRTYTNDDIEEYARVWTGFLRQGERGNIEKLNGNQIDPMKVFAAWRDRFPKMGLSGLYVGDGYPLCEDLPSRHFLSKGAVYLLLDSPAPEHHADPIEWRTDSNATHLVLDPSSQLSSKLLADAPQVKIVLDEAVACTGVECTINTIRTVKTGGFYYEYIRAACVHPAFFSDARAIAKRVRGGQPMCGNPLVETATAACCGDNISWNESYFGERTNFATAQERCNNNLCSLEERPMCTGTQCLGDSYYWTGGECALKAKVDLASGKVAIVHEPNGVGVDDIGSIVRASNAKTFFRVDWDGDVKETLADCDALASCSLTDDRMCLCSISVQDEAVFTNDFLPSQDDIINSLHIGAIVPDGIDAQPLANDPNVNLYGSEITSSSVFETTDETGRSILRTNKRSIVTVDGTKLTFRNPVHFLGLADAEERDAIQETDATLDHYFYHQNTAPFVAYRFAQRFGNSNPSPRYTKVIADAFTAGSYVLEVGDSTVEFGTGNYGDLAATFAALLLDREARDFVLDADPASGSLKEPLIKIMGMMRALQFELNSLYKWVEFAFDFGETIGQMAHQLPSVFSFFLPEFQPAGPVSQASLASPEAQILTAPRIVGQMNGILSMIKYGLTGCQGGFGPKGYRKYCSQTKLGSTWGPGVGELKSSAKLTVAELATLMTAGRLNQKTRRLIESVLADQQEPTIKAQMLISATPEFHSVGTSQPTDENVASRAAPTFTSEDPYKAVVYILLTGGYDSFNTLVPSTCAATNGDGKTLVEQYEFERSTLALKEEERTRLINATGQACEQFAIHPEMEVLERLYNGGDLSFFANVGQLDAPVTKDNYFLNTRSQLFAHNAMQEEAQRLDPWDKVAGTGILGRMCDVLAAKGYTSQTVTVQDASVATVGVPGASAFPLVASLRGPEEFAPGKGSDGIDINDHVANLNNATQTHSSVFGGTWSSRFLAALDDNEKLAAALEQVDLTQAYEIPEEGGNYVRTVQTLSNLILTQKDRGSDRDVIFATIGGWDHHAQMKENLATEFRGFNQGLTLFESEMKAQGMWDQVTVVVASDFGRTLTANSNGGSDHAWGGHYFMLGGAVKGGQIHGEYPPDISPAGPVNIGRGRIIPTSSWESMFNGPLQWMGLDTEAELDYAMPNRLKSGAKLFTANEVFTSSSRTRRSLRQHGVKS